MQQLALQHTASTQWPMKMTALERDARNLNHPTGSDGFSVADADKPAIRPYNSSEGLPGTRSLSHAAQSNADQGLSTNDFVGSALNIASGALLGGPIGALTAAAGELFEAISGDSLVGHIASVFSEPGTTSASSVLAAHRAYSNAVHLNSLQQ